MKLEQVTVTVDGQSYVLPIGEDVTRYDALVLYLKDIVDARKGDEDRGTFEYAIVDGDDLVRRRR